MTDRGNFLLSLVVPAYNEQDGLGEFYNRISKVLKDKNYNYELIFVNDGSRDDTLLLLLKLADEDKRVKVLSFSRNFGHQVAVSAGLDYADGDAVVIIDADLQDPPELVPELVAKWQEGYEVVNAMRKSRKDGFFKLLTAKVFYKSLNMLLSSKIPENVGDFRLLDHKAVQILRKMHEKDRYLRGLTNWIGFKQSFVMFDRDKRFAGETHYPLSKMINLGLNAIYSFSTVPMKMANAAGLLFILSSLLIIIYTLVVHFLGLGVPGWTSQVIITLGVGAVQMFVLGIISEYVGRIYTQVQDRPLYIISEKANFDKQEDKQA